jgi:hypothetical protein
MQTQHQFGGKQAGAGRPALPPEKRARKVEVWLPPDVYAAVVLSVGNGRGAVPREIIRLLRKSLATDTR